MASRREEREARRELRRHAEAEAQARERRQRMIGLISGAVFLAVIAVVAAIVISQSGSSGGTDVTNVSKVRTELQGIPQHGPVLGDPSAKATLVEFGDLQCSTCAFYANSIMPHLFSGPVRSGKAKIEFRPVLVIGPQSVPAAAAANAAGEQNRFWSFIETFYANQGQENSGYVTDDFMTAVAKAAGVADIAKWDTDRKSPQWKRQLAQHMAQFQGFGFSGTPSFAIQSGSGPLQPIPGQGGTSVLTLGQLEAAINRAG